MTTNADIAEARKWLAEHCHVAHVRHTLQRGLEYAASIEKAGLCPIATTGDDLYAFLSSPEAGPARARAFVEPSL